MGKIKFNPTLGTIKGVHLNIFLIYKSYIAHTIGSQTLPSRDSLNQTKYFCDPSGRLEAQFYSNKINRCSNLINQPVKVFCTNCARWVHGRCTSMKRVTPGLAENFVCTSCTTLDQVACKHFFSFKNFAILSRPTSHVSATHRWVATPTLRNAGLCYTLGLYLIIIISTDVSTHHMFYRQQRQKLF